MTAADEKLMSPDNSPKTANMKKSGRRLNNRPIAVLFILIGVVCLAFGMVFVGRSTREKEDVGKTTIKSAGAYAKEIISGIEAGMVPAAVPDLPAKEEIPESPPESPKVPDRPPPADQPAPPQTPPQTQGEELPDSRNAPKNPNVARLSDERRKARERRWRQVEQALDAPIKVQIDDQKRQNRSGADELENIDRQLALLGQQSGQSYMERLTAMRAALDGGTGNGTDFSRRNDLSRMEQFSGNASGWENPHGVEAPLSINVIRTGWVIPATLIAGINSDLPGQIIAQVSQDVFDTPTGKRLLIPQGSRLVGEYSSQIEYGQSRVFVVWQRVIMPDGKALDIGAMPGSSGAGYAGLKDRVNHHYGRIFGSAILMSAIMAGVEMTQSNRGYSYGSNQQRMADAMSEQLGNQLGGVMAEMISKNMSISPTIEIRPGYRLNVMVTKDLYFDGPYTGFDWIR